MTNLVGDRHSLRARARKPARITPVTDRNNVGRAMKRHNNSAIDRRAEAIVAGLPAEVDKLKALLKLLGGSVAGWARQHGFRAEEVHMTLRGARPYPAIREEIAKSVGLTREEVDRVIDEAKQSHTD